MSKGQSLWDRFHDKFIPEPNSGCWLWISTQNQNGYGTIEFGSRCTETRRVKQATHVAWELYCGPVPDGMVMCHKCDNPVCVNPEHLFPDTDLDNHLDCVAKGRHVKPPLIQGERHPRAKLTEEAVLDIRSGQLSGKEYAAKYGVSDSMISYVKRGHNWKCATPGIEKKVKPPRTAKQIAHAAYMKQWSAKKRVASQALANI